MDREAVRRWMDGYERLWRTPGTDRLAELFSSTATYLPSPWADPVVGLPAIAEFWTSERAGADEPFTMSSEIVAAESDTAVVRVQVAYEAPEAGIWRDLWVLRFAPDGLCSSFEEWPFAPTQPDGH